MRNIITLLILVVSIVASAQQEYYTKSKKAVKYFKSALNNYHLQYFDIAKKELAKALEKDNKFIDAYILLGEISSEEGNKQAAIEYFTKAISVKADYNPLMYLRRADMEKSCGLYERAKKDYATFIKLKKNNSKYEKYIKQKIGDCDFAIKQKNNPVKFNPVNLGEQINTALSEYWASLTADGNTLIFTVSDRKKNSQEDLYYSKKENGKWQKAQRMSAPVNTPKSEGAQAISADGRTMVFTACLRADSRGSCDLYISHKIGDKWTVPTNMQSPINTRYKESQPCLSADGKTIYFASNRPGSMGKFDIWKSSLQANGKWSNPVNLGKSVNTKENELAPFIHYDNSTLYFASEGKQGMGGSDLFMSRKTSSGKWSEAVNLPYPINTHNNEESLVIATDGKSALFSSDMQGGYGQKDIYMFDLPPTVQANKTIFIKGKVVDAETKKSLSAQINISSLTSDSVKITSRSDKQTGEFLCCLSPKKTYAFNVNKKGYMLYSQNISLPDTSYIITIELQKIKSNLKIISENIFFQYNSYNLDNKSFIELRMLSEFINENKLYIEISGHTDNKGSTEYNKLLSTRRAKAVYDFLISIGVNKQFLTYKGYGFDKPISTNNTEEGRAKNRRIEFKILSQMP